MYPNLDYLVLDASQHCYVSEFRRTVPIRLFKPIKWKEFVTDKMPQNFRFIALICAAFLEAKIVHVKLQNPALPVGQRL